MSEFPPTSFKDSNFSKEKESQHNKTLQDISKKVSILNNPEISYYSPSNPTNSKIPISNCLPVGLQPGNMEASNVLNSQFQNNHPTNVDNYPKNINELSTIIPQPVSGEETQIQVPKIISVITSEKSYIPEPVKNIELDNDNSNINDQKSTYISKPKPEPEPVVVANIPVEEKSKQNEEVKQTAAYEAPSPSTNNRNYPPAVNEGIPPVDVSQWQKKANNSVPKKKTKRCACQ